MGCGAQGGAGGGDYEETFGGNTYVNELNHGDGFTEIHLCQIIYFKNYILSYVNYASRKLLNKYLK